MAADRVQDRGGEQATTPHRSTAGRSRRPDLETVYTINADGSRNFLHPADVRGRWQSRKNLIWILLIAVYAILPWIQIGGHPAAHFNLPGRTAYLFGLSFTNQDFYLAFFLFAGLGFALFVATSLWGRIWCGYACPQTVFMEGVFRRIERWIEGPRDTRIRRNLGPATWDKVWRKGLKQLVFLGLSWVIAHVFLSYFIPPRDLLAVMQEGPAAHRSAFFWTMFWTVVLYFDYAWFREQTCLVICPYGRLQSVLVDQDTVVIGYDEARGEPRVKLGADGGDCIDCYRCVAVCPTGIDIRNGLQMECIGCANCIDACDEVMERVDRPRGLVRYDSQRSFARAGARRIFRPRVAFYALFGLAFLVAGALAIGSRTTFEVRALRSRGLPYTLEEGRIRNVGIYRIQNKTDEDQTYFVSASAPGDHRATVSEAADQDSTGPPVEFIVTQGRVRIPGLGDASIPIVAFVTRDRYLEPFPFAVTVSDSATGERKTVEVLFRGP